MLQFEPSNAYRAPLRMQTRRDWYGWDGRPPRPEPPVAVRLVTLPQPVEQHALPRQEMRQLLPMLLVVLVLRAGRAPAWRAPAVRFRGASLVPCSSGRGGNGFGSR